MLIYETVTENRRLDFLGPDLQPRLTPLALVVSQAMFDVATVCILWGVSFLGKSPRH